ncbi:MAG: response regulator [Candidatus Pacebacteria bacterium]|nr:response regulator [Candidatus Paceibacterota bacterium]
MSIKDFFVRQKKVLIVEDDVTLRTSLKEKFEEKGFVVFEAGDAKMVLATMESFKPSALVLDLILPLKDGVSLLEEIRDSGYKQPVIILSNLLGSDLLRADAKRLNAEFYNKSSTSLDSIVVAVTEHL